MFRGHNQNRLTDVLLGVTKTALKTLGLFQVFHGSD